MLVDMCVEVHCIQPSWVQLENSRYRIYLDNELMTERDWVWDQNIYINEHLLADILPNTAHTIKVEVIKSNPAHLTELVFRNFLVEDVLHDTYTHEIHRDTLSFSIA
jgi:hypothetical protein